jgi:hypothetical protein
VINPSTPSITISGATCANQWLQLMAADMESWKVGRGERDIMDLSFEEETQ